MTTQPSRKGLSLLSNNNCERGRLVRQIGKSNLLAEKSDPKSKAVASKERVPLQPIVVVQQEKTAQFEVYCDDDDGQTCSTSFPTVIEVQHEKENDKSTHDRFQSCSEDSESSVAPASIAGTFRSAFSDICVEDADDSQSSLYSSALDYTSDYETALSSRDEHEDRIFCHPVFCNDIYSYMRQKESRHRVKKNYLDKQQELNAEMRAILMDWLNDVIIEFNLQQETLHLAVSLVDRTLTRFRVERAKLQLVGATALMIAAKYEEIYPPELKDFVYITDSTYQGTQLLLMERTILSELDFEVSVPTSQWFATRFAKIQKAKPRTISAMLFLIDLMLLESDSSAFRPSIVAAAALCYANVLTGPTPWSTDMETRTGIAVTDMTRVLRRMHELFSNARESKLQSMYSKYDTNEMHHVASLPAPSTLPL